MLSKRPIARYFVISCAVLLLLMPYGSAFAQDAPASESLFFREQVANLQQEIDRLYQFLTLVIAVLSIGATAIVIYIENSSRSERKQERDRQEKSGRIIDGVMGSVKELLDFQAEQAKLLKEREEKIAADAANVQKMLEYLAPAKKIDSVFEEVNWLRQTVKRGNIYRYSTKIVELDRRIKNTEDWVSDPILEDSIGCHYVHGLAAHLESRIDDELHHFTRVLENISKKQNTGDERDPHDTYIEPLSLFFLGVLYKNVNNLEEAVLNFRRAKQKWPHVERKYEIRTLVELAEAVALQTNYGKDETQVAFAEIEKEDADVISGAMSRSEDQEKDVAVLKERLYLIRGNSASMKGNFDDAAENYQLAIDARSGNSGFAHLALATVYLNNSGLNHSTNAHDLLATAYKLLAERYSTHPERRGRILAGGAAIISARLSQLTDAYIHIIEADVTREIGELSRINGLSPYQFHVFSPLTKQMETISAFSRHILNPADYLAQIAVN